MGKSIVPNRVILRLAHIGDLDLLMALYTEQASDVLPPPTLKDLASAIEDGRLFVVQGPDGLLACSALVPLTSATCHSYVGELTGTFVAKPLRGGKPIGVQAILLGLRVLHHAVLLGDVTPPASNSLVTIVKKGNTYSSANVTRAGFVPCPERPPWLKYDELSWHGDHVEDEWEYFRATPETVKHLATQLIDHGLLDGKFTITIAEEPVDIHLRGFKELSRAREDLIAIAKGELEIPLSALPAKLSYAKPPDDPDAF